MSVDGRYVDVVEGEPVRVQTWADIHDPDNLLDPALVGVTVARLHAVVVPATTPPHWWGTDPVGATEWQALVKAARGAGAPFAEDLAALVPQLLAAEELLTPMTGHQWLHLDLWADNLRGTPDGSACVIDFDNAGPGDPTRELAMVLFEFARSDAARVDALVTAYESAGGSGRLTRPEDFGLHDRPAAPHREVPGARLAERSRPRVACPRTRRRTRVRRRPADGRRWRSGWWAGPRAKPSDTVTPTA